MITLKEIKKLYPEFYQRYSQSKFNKKFSQDVLSRICDFLDANGCSVGVNIIQIENGKELFYPFLRFGDKPIESFKMNQFRSLRDAKALGVEKALAKIEYGDYKLKEAIEAKITLSNHK